MNWTLNIPQKFKTSLLLMAIVSTVIITSFWGKSSISELNASFSSIYKDRLLPANELFHITDLMYQKRLLIEKYYDPTTEPASIQKDIHNMNHQIDSILMEYEKSYLVAEETRSLSHFKVKMKDYIMAEQELLNGGRAGTDELQKELLILFDDIRSELITLSQIQMTVGRELMDDSEQIKSHSSLIHYCQLALIMVIMLIVQGIIFSARTIVPKKAQDYRLN